MRTLMGLRVRFAVALLVLLALLVPAIPVAAAGLTVTPGNGSLPDGKVGANYSKAINATGGTAPYTFAVTATSPLPAGTTGGLPPGLTLSTAPH